jgi:hypothetical protein
VHRTLLELIIHTRERTQVEEVAGFNNAARRRDEHDATLSIRTLRRWITGEVATKPRAAQRRVAEAYWGHPMDDLLAPPQPGVLVAMRDTGLTERSGGTDPAGLVTAERRITMVARRAARFTADTESIGIGPETLDELRDDVAHLATAYLRDPVTTLLGPLAETQDSVFGMLETRQRPAQAAELYLLAGVVSALLAKVSQDLGRPREAMTQARTAYVCADNAGHTGLRSWCRGLQSLITYWNGRPGEAARYARLGAEELRDGHGSVSAWLPALEARAWALAGGTDSAVHAIAQADDARQQLVADDLDTIGGLFSFPAAKQHYYSSGALVHLGGDAADRANSEAVAALDLYEADTGGMAYSDAAGARSELALARVFAGELDGAAEAIAPVLDLEPERRIAGIVESTARVHAALRAPKFAASPTARGIRAEIEAFNRVSAAELPR